MDENVSPLFNVPISGDAMTMGSIKPTNKTGSSMTPQKYVEKDKKHTGVAGVARDVLGTLGDFLLTKLGMPTMYAPAQKQRKLANSLANFDQDPRTAIAEATSIDVGIGNKLRDQFIDNTRLEETRLDRNENNDARLDLARERAEIARQLKDEKSYGSLAGMVESMASWDNVKRAKNYGQMRAAILSNGKRMGLPTDVLETELPAEFDEVALDAFADRYVPVERQRGQRLTKERMDNQAEQAKARDTTTRRGQDISSRDRVRGQDIVSSDKAKGRATTERGQNIRASKAPAKGQVLKLPNGVTVRIK